MQTKQQSIMKEQKIINHTPEIEAYLKSIRKYKTMTKAEEKAMFEEYQTAAPARKAQIVDMIVKANQRFVFSEAKKYAKGDDTKILDFVSEGNIGLVKSIDTFDYTKEFKFISYAVWGIKQHMTNYAETQNKFMKNANNKKIGNKIIKFKAAFFQEWHRDPTVDEIKEELEKQGIKIKKDSDLEDVVQNSIDSVWVKVARDQITQGWIRESELLQGVSRDDPISQFIDVFSNTHLLVFLAICVVVAGAYAVRKLLRRRAYIVHFHDIDSIYPTLLCVLIALSATLYASIQMFGAESWRHYYFHPSLNPFALPLHLGLFVASVWAIILVAVAVLDDVRHKLPTFDALLYLSGLAAVCAVVYVVFSVSTLYYIGYLLLVAYLVFAFRCYQRHPHYRYQCGQCGAKLKHRGRCPHCGALNA